MLFERVAANGDGALSLAEIDQAVVDLWPEFTNKPALVRAYHSADKSTDGLITQSEFGTVLMYALYFNALWPKLERIENSAVSRFRLQVYRWLAAASKARWPLAARPRMPLWLLRNHNANCLRCDCRCRSSEGAASSSACFLRR